MLTKLFRTIKRLGEGEKNYSKSVQKHKTINQKQTKQQSNNKTTKGRGRMKLTEANRIARSMIKEQNERKPRAAPVPRQVPLYSLSPATMPYTPASSDSAAAEW